MKNVLITGGTGLIGQHLTKLLLDKGYSVSYLSRKATPVPGINVFRWDIEKGYLDPAALLNVDCLIHLAGAGIADQRWSPKRKATLLHSRTEGLRLLEKELNQRSEKPQVLLSASGIAYYGTDTKEIRQTEQSPAGNDFLARLTAEWEAAANSFTQLGIRTVKFRTGIVLSKEGGALPKIAAPARWGLGAPLGSGQQWCSWIHIDDLCRLYLEAMENQSWEGPYNAVAEAPVTNKELTRLICKTLGTPQWLPNIPKLVLKAMLGEMAVVVLGSSFIENKRIKTETHFNYHFTNLQNALSSLLAN